jgi:hypothetical protein
MPQKSRSFAHSLLRSGLRLKGALGTCGCAGLVGVGGVVLLGVVGLLLVSGIFWSGTWEDDKKNWKRAFQQEQPKGIAVIHSWYCRTPHFTFESQYFFELRLSDAMRAAFTDPGHVLEVSPNDYTSLRELELALDQKPSWFAPKATEDYEIFQGKEPDDSYFLLLDRAGERVFITDRTGM